MPKPLSSRPTRPRRRSRWSVKRSSSSPPAPRPVATRSSARPAPRAAARRRTATHGTRRSTSSTVRSCSASMPNRDLVAKAGTLVHVPGGSTHWFRFGAGGGAMISMTSRQGPSAFFTEIDREVSPTDPDFDSVARHRIRAQDRIRRPVGLNAPRLPDRLLSRDSATDFSSSEQTVRRRGHGDAHPRRLGRSS